MGGGMKLDNYRLTTAEANQVRAYIRWAEEEGSYYGNAEQFMKRHKRIKEVFTVANTVEPPKADA